MIQKSKKVKLVEVPSELGAGTRGASLGVDALKLSLLKTYKAILNEPSVRVPVKNEALFCELKTPNAKFIEQVVEVNKSLAKEVKLALQEGSYPIILTGDHSSARGSLAGIKNAFPDKRLGVIWIDAHADLNSPYTTPSGNLHGMPLGAALGQDYDKTLRKISSEEEKLWQAFKTLSAPICHEDIVFIGLRSIDEFEQHYITSKDIAAYSIDQLRQKGLSKTIEEILSYLNACDIIAVSFDVDSLDPKFSSFGTGTPEPNGLKVEEAEVLLKAFTAIDKVVSLEFTEINPLLDTKNTMAEIVAKLLKTILI